MTRFVKLIILIVIFPVCAFAQVKSLAAKEKINDFSKNVEIFLSESNKFLDAANKMVDNAHAQKENLEIFKSNFDFISKFDKKTYSKIKNVPKILSKKHIVFLENDLQQLVNNFQVIHEFCKNFRVKFEQSSNDNKKIETIDEFISNETFVIEKCNTLNDSILKRFELFNQTSKLILPAETYSFEIKSKRKKENRTKSKIVQSKKTPSFKPVELPLPTIDREVTNIKTEKVVEASYPIVEASYPVVVGPIVQNTSSNPFHLPNQFIQSNNLNITPNYNSSFVGPSLASASKQEENLSNLLSEDFNLLSSIYHQINNKNFSNLLMMRLQLNQLNLILADRKKYLKNQSSTTFENENAKKFYSVLEYDFVQYLNALFLRFSVKSSEKVFTESNVVFQLNSSFQKIEAIVNGYNF